MKIISHRANLDGPSKYENSMQSIEIALSKGFDVEIDVWFLDGSFFLGHDYPQDLVSIEFLRNPNLWIHAKNLKSLEMMCEKIPFGNFFWHQTDDFTLTSKKYIWTYPGKMTTSRSIIVITPDDRDFEKYSNCFGICTDYPEEAKRTLDRMFIEKKYDEYVYNCTCVEETPLSIGEFFQAVNGDTVNMGCEICLVHPEMACECKRKKGYIVTNE